MKTEKKPKRKGFLYWLVRGTVSEPRPTHEEMLSDPKLQEKIEVVREIFSREKKRRARKL